MAWHLAIIRRFILPVGIAQKPTCLIDYFAKKYQRSDDCLILSNKKEAILFGIASCINVIEN